MSNRSSIHYKFKTENVNKVVTFDGNQILADELKRLIAKDEGINLELFELSLTDDSTNKSYDEEFVPKNVVVVVRRLPKENVVKMPKVNNTEGSGVVPAKTTLQIAPVHINEEIFSKMSEEERLAHINQVSAIKYDPRSYGKPSMIGKASPSYQCSKCSGFGHFPKQCPLAHIRRATGIPADELMETTPDNPNAYLHVSGKYVVPKIHEQAREQRKIVDKLTAQRLQGNFPLLSTKMEKIDIPEEFKCPICKELMKDAVLVPCCGESFCLDCIENVMLQTSLTEEGSRCLCSTILRANSLYDNKSLRRAITKFQKEHLSKVNLKNVDGSLSLAAKPVPITDNMDFSENLPPLHRPNESPEKLLDDYVRVVNPFDTVMPAVSTVIMDSNRSPLTETTVSVNVQTAISFSSTQPIIPLIGKAEDFTNDSSNGISSLSPLTIPSPLHSVGFPLFDQTMMSSMPMIPQQSLPLISSEQMQISSQIIPTLPTLMSSTMPTKTMTSSKIDMDDDKKAAFEEAKAKIWDEMVISESLEIADWFPESNLKKRKRDENEPERCEKRRREEKPGKCEHERHRKDEDKPKRDRERYDGRGKETEKVEESKKEGDERLRREKNEVDRHKRHGSKEKDEKRRREERKEKKESEKHGKDRKKSERREKDKKREKKEKKREKKEKREKEKKKDHRERDRSRSR